MPGSESSTRSDARTRRAEPAPTIGGAPVTVLVIEDDPLIRRLVDEALASVADRTIGVATGAAALATLDEVAPDLVILDLGLPDVDGLELCRTIRRRSTAPIVVVTARHGLASKIALLDEGADDYVTKPFATAELVARLRAQLRRARLPREGAPLRVVRAGGLTLDFEARTAHRGRTRIRLTPVEWALLRTFVSHRGRTLTHQQLASAIWSDAGGAESQALLRVHIANLRRKIELDQMEPQLIVTESGVGYRFQAAEGASPDRG
jgi:two-component system KDP operon response regulator KdpE